MLFYQGNLSNPTFIPEKLFSMAFYQGNLSNPTVILRNTYPIQHLFQRKKLFETTYFPGKTYPAQCLFWRKLIQSSIFSGETFQYSIISGSLSSPAFILEKKMFNPTVIPGKTYPIQHLFRRKFSVQQYSRGAYPI
jgi:hypothetical protein